MRRRAPVDNLFDEGTSMKSILSGSRSGGLGLLGKAVVVLGIASLLAVSPSRPPESRAQDAKAQDAKGRPRPRGRTCLAAEGFDALYKASAEFRAARERIDGFTRNYERTRAERDPGLRDGVIIIPVVVHVVYNTAAQNVSDQQIQSQIDVLNLDYRRMNSDASSVPAVFQPVATDPRIQFQLAARDPNCGPTNGITRTKTTVTVFVPDTNNPTTQAGNPVKFAASGGHDAWPSSKYLNIWVCNMGGNPLGYSSFPGFPANVDGVVIDYTCFGNTGTVIAPYNLGRTATHEIGHWLNLFHTFQGGCAGTGAGNCSTGGDQVCDTPGVAGPNFGCPPLTTNSCTDSPTDLPDQTMNYMDYTDDACMYMFTLGQSVRIDATLAGVRSSVVGSDALIPPPAGGVAGLFSQDKPGDTGAEPDPLAANMYQSDDIWVRNQNDGVVNQQHQNPVYRPAGPSNFVYVRIRNRGCQDAASAATKLYWAKASSALGWPAPWDGSVTSPALMGSLIASNPTGVVAGGGFVILEFPWSPPNPADYVSFGADKSHFCLLSRIETSSTPPFGMTTPEGPDLNANVRDNNKIVWKNVSVVDSGGGGRIGWVTINNNLRDEAPIALIFSTPKDEQKPALLRSGTVLVDLGDPLFNAWTSGGSAGKRIKVEGRQIVIEGPDAVIEGIKLGPRDYYTIGVEFRPNRDLLRGDYLFHLDMNQYESRPAGQKLMGGQTFVLKGERRGQ
jgi:hypothetical protein